MAIYTKRLIRSKTIDLPSLFLSFSQIILIRLSPKMRRFTYSGIRRRGCEGTSCYYELGKYSVAASILNSVGYCTILKCIPW